MFVALLFAASCGAENEEPSSDCQGSCMTIRNRCCASTIMSECIEGCNASFSGPSCQACFDDLTCSVFLPCLRSECGVPDDFCDDW